MSRRRFIVASVTGYNIPSSPKAREVTDYMIQDTANCHRVVASFPAAPNGNPSPYVRKCKAHALADELNRGDEAWRDALARDAEHAA